MKRERRKDKCREEEEKATVKRVRETKRVKRKMTKDKAKGERAK